MPYFTVDIDIDKCDILEELTDQDIIKAFDERGLGNSVAVMSDKEAVLTLEMASDFLRAQGQLSLASRLDELRYKF